MLLSNHLSVTSAVMKDVQLASFELVNGLLAKNTFFVSFSACQVRLGVSILFQILADRQACSGAVALSNEVTAVN